MTFKPYLSPSQDNQIYMQQTMAIIPLQYKFLFSVIIHSPELFPSLYLTLTSCVFSCKFFFFLFPHSSCLIQQVRSLYGFFFFTFFFLPSPILITVLIEFTSDLLHLPWVYIQSVFSLVLCHLTCLLFLCIFMVCLSWFPLLVLYWILLPPVSKCFYFHHLAVIFYLVSAVGSVVKTLPLIRKSSVLLKPCDQTTTVIILSI